MSLRRYAITLLLLAAACSSGKGDAPDKEANEAAPAPVHERKNALTKAPSESLGIRDDAVHEKMARDEAKRPVRSRDTNADEARDAEVTALIESLEASASDSIQDKLAPLRRKWQKAHAEAQDATSDLDISIANAKKGAIKSELEALAAKAKP